MDSAHSFTHYCRSISPKRWCTTPFGISILHYQDLRSILLLVVSPTYTNLVSSLYPCTNRSRSFPKAGIPARIVYIDWLVTSAQITVRVFRLHACIEAKSDTRAKLRLASRSRCQIRGIKASSSAFSPKSELTRLLSVQTC